MGVVMAAIDVILTANACSSQAPCSKWASFFEDKPLILSVPGSGGTFLKKGRQWGATGDAFRAAIRELAPEYKDVEIRRRALVTFSVGWQLGHHMLLNPKEQELLDAYILEDGLHSRDLDHWVNFATRAANGDAWMAMAHCQIAPPYVSTKETNETVFRRAVERNDASEAPRTKLEELPDYLANPEIPEDGIRITVSAVKDLSGKVVLPAQTKVWDKDCLESWDNRGNLYLFEYAGNDRSDHCFLAWHVAPRLWKLLADRWREVPAGSPHLT
jgi:hypothetical protein